MTNEEQEAYDDGIWDMWDCIRDIVRMGKDNRRRLFRETNVLKIVKEYNPWEVIRIVETYKKQQKLKNNEYVKEISKLQTYKLHENSKKMVLLNEVIGILIDEKESEE